MLECFGLSTNYFETGKGETVLFLHGWGSDISDFLGTAKHFGKCYHTICLDLWGFGKSEAPKSVWGTKDYKNAVLEFSKKLGLKSFHLVGHSFGGKVAIKYASEESGIKSLTLVDSAGMKARFSLKTYLKIKKYKSLKKKVENGKQDKKVLEKFGSTDFKNSCGVMQKILTKVVNENVEEESKHINVPTLLVWGKHDKDTPLYMAKRLQRNILGSKLCVFEGGHFCHINNFSNFNNLLEKFWRGL